MASVAASLSAAAGSYPKFLEGMRKERELPNDSFAVE
jgi:hypothetical protein